MRALDRLADDDPLEVDLTRAGHGAGVVETARGPLAYFVDAADGRVRRLRSVAPTEWNFHPDGPFIAALDARACKSPIRCSPPGCWPRASIPACRSASSSSADRRAPANAEIALHA